MTSLNRINQNGSPVEGGGSDKNMMNNSPLPLTRNLTLAYTLSLVIALLMTGASLAGLIFQSNFYSTEELRRSFVSNDVVNLFIGLPILLGSMALTRRGRLIGLLFWPGALFYTFYNYIAYAIAMPQTLQFVLYLALVAMCAITIFHLVSSINGAMVQQQLAGSIPVRFAGGVLIGFGVLFFLRNIGQAAGALTGQASLSWPEIAVLAADFVVMPCWVVGGILLWRRRALGYVTGAGLLFQASMLFIGLLVFFILQPFLTATPFPVVDFLVVFAMGLVCFVPFGLFVRGMITIVK